MKNKLKVLWRTMTKVVGGVLSRIWFSVFIIFSWGVALYLMETYEWIKKLAMWVAGLILILIVILITPLFVKGLYDEFLAIYRREKQEICKLEEKEKCDELD